MEHVRVRVVVQKYVERKERAGAQWGGDENHGRGLRGD